MRGGVGSCRREHSTVVRYTKVPDVPKPKPQITSTSMRTLYYCDVASTSTRSQSLHLNVFLALNSGTNPALWMSYTTAHPQICMLCKHTISCVSSSAIFWLHPSTHQNRIVSIPQNVISLFLIWWRYYLWQIVSLDRSISCVRIKEWVGSYKSPHNNVTYLKKMQVDGLTYHGIQPISLFCSNRKDCRNSIEYHPDIDITKPTSVAVKQYNREEPQPATDTSKIFCALWFCA